MTPTGRDLVTSDATAEDLVAVLVAAMAAKLADEEVDDEAAQFAMTALVAAQLIRSGMDPDAVEALFERDHILHLSYNDGELGVEVHWADPLEEAS
jgi:hypothetical protein